MSGGKKMIYLDYAATAPMSDEALEVFTIASKKFYGNAASLHDVGSAAENMLEMCRKELGALINGDETGIYFTSSASEANELAILSLVEGNKHKGKHLITTEAEHSSVFNIFKYLEQTGYEVTYLAINLLGEIDLDILRRSIREDTILVSIQHGNSEIGAVQDIAEIGEILANAGVIFHADCVQTFGKIPLDVVALKIDSLSVSSHKVYGPKGIGACYINPNVHWERQIKKITQEMGFRAGTVDVPSIMSFTHAAKQIVGEMRPLKEKYTGLRAYFLEKLALEKLPIELIGSEQSELPSIVALSFSNMQGQYIMLEYNRYNIAVSTGSACQVNQLEPSRTMTSMGKNPDEAKQLIRMSFGMETTVGEIERTIAVTKRIMADLQG